MQRNRFCTLLIAFAASAYGQARAEEDVDSMIEPSTVTVEAQKLEIHLDRKLSAIGQAELHRDESALFGDRIDYDMINSKIHVIGNVQILENGNTFSGPELKMKLDDRVGELKEAIFTIHNMKKPSRLVIMPPGSTQTNNPVSTSMTGQHQIRDSRGNAELVQFDGPNKELLKNTTYTTCEVGNDAWYLHAQSLELDHYSQIATARNASLEFKGTPILYTPWMDFPMNAQRKTGFLSPTWSTNSSNGIDISEPFYWNIAPNMDAEITTRVMSRRGVQVQSMFEYLEDNYKGEDHLDYLPSDNDTGKSRWMMSLFHEQNFGNGWSGGFNYQRVSDNQYFSDLSSGIILTSTVILPQQAHLNFSNETWKFNALVQAYQTLDGASYPYQQLPQLTLQGHKDWDFVIGDLYSQWANFKHSDSAPVSVSVPAAPGATLQTGTYGNRAILYPSISVPFNSAYGYITPKLGINYTKYDINNTNYTLTDVLGNTTTGNFTSAARTLPIFSVDSGMYFDRDFNVIHNAYTQTLEPRLYYVYIPNRDQSRLPVFDTALSDISMTSLFQENQFSGYDRINDANQMSLALTSRLIDKSTGFERLAVTFGERFYFANQHVTLPGAVPSNASTSDFIAAMNAHLLTHWNVDAGILVNTSTGGTDRQNVGLHYAPEPGKSLNLTYRYNKGTINEVDLSSEWPLGNRWYGLGRFNYSFLDNSQIAGDKPGIIETIAGLEYDGGCWQARTVIQRVSTATANASYGLFFQFDLSGLTSLGTASPLDLLKRSIPGYTKTGFIPDVSIQ